MPRIIPASVIAGVVRVGDCETFAAVPLPADATTGRELSTLIEREDIAAVCSADHLAQRSRNPARTTGWRIQA